MEPRTIEIPMFGFDEALVIERLLGASGVAFRKEVLELGADPLGGRHAYTFRVPEEQFQLAIALLKEHFGLRPDLDGATGGCPACGAPIRGESRCPDCGLNVSGDYSGVTKAHPFVMFLKMHDLL